VARQFNPRFLALGGTEDEVHRVARAYKVFYEKVLRPSQAGSRFDHCRDQFGNVAADRL